MKSFNQFKDAGFHQLLFLRAGGTLFFRQRRGALEHVALQDRPPGQQVGGFLEGLVLQKLADQLRARVVFQFFGRRLLRNRQQQAGLDVNQRGGHHQIFACQIQIKRLDEVQIIQVLTGDERDGNVINIDLIFFDQIQKQIQRTFKNIQFDRVVCLWLFVHRWLQILTASRTSAMVWRAIAAASSLPF
ncbi:MAG: hypothetical protein BWX45_00855 [Deltaproteobacteria bacterium ADurb.Bin002]|nr:MAG: hypothetical protein BWX45_00855 [Deltaproteobacteria bacterium ADurb.Bin002]